MSFPVSGTVQSPVPYGASNYPFSDAATMTSNDGQFVPPDVFIDARVFARGGEHDMHVSSIRLGVTGLEITISDSTGERATAEVTDPSSALAGFLDAQGRQVGVLLGDFLRLLAVIPGPRVLEFRPAALPFAATALVPVPIASVEGVLSTTDQFMSGEVWLVGGAGVRVTGDPGTNTIRVDVVGDRFFKRRACNSGDQVFTTPHSLRAITVNGSDPIEPDEFGNMQFIIGSGGAEDNILRIEPVLNGLRLRLVSGNT